ncbi:MAG: galactokinase family protein [Eubacteriales bacterium]|nr:galactokinase family protein [Eubacteriales bacterium]
MDKYETKFRECFGREPEYLFSVPGRTELGGNHTDHQHGCVVAAAINLEMLSLVAKNDTGIIRVQSEGYSICEIDTRDLKVKPSEINTTASLIRGVAAGLNGAGAKIGGFDAYCTSNIPVGGGLSSSAAFEVLIGAILNILYNDGKFTPTELAQIGQYAETAYFGKPSGLMDQMACSLGNAIGIDFKNPSEPVVEKVGFDFSNSGYALCIIDSGADHAKLTHEYAAIPAEMCSVAAFFEKEVLRDVDENEFYENIASVRAKCGDRAVLRAIHFFNENRRAKEQLECLMRGDFEGFLALVRESGRSSRELLQNIVPAGYTCHQEMGFAISLAEHLLRGQGAVRVHGGGFAGTIQAFVPDDMLKDFKKEIEKVLGEGRCQVLSIRPEGAVLVKKF